MSRTTEITLTPADPIGTSSASSSAASASTKAGGRVRETAMRGRSDVRSGYDGWRGGAERLAERGLGDGAGDQLAAVLPTARRGRPSRRAATSENSRVPSSGSTIQTRLAESLRLVVLPPSSDRTASSGRCVGEQLHQQLVGGQVAGVLELAALETLAAHLEQPLARDGRQPLGQHVVVGAGRRRTVRG